MKKLKYRAHIDTKKEEEGFELTTLKLEGEYEFGGKLEGPSVVHPTNYILIEFKSLTNFLWMEGEGLVLLLLLFSFKNNDR